ncbi:MAG TPA: hypothetical protein VGD58_04710 [Herpetosiphonaceae bacterium]
MAEGEPRTKNQEPRTKKTEQRTKNKEQKQVQNPLACRSGRGGVE